MSKLKIIVMGVGGVGKTALTQRFVVGRWVKKYDPTVEECSQTTVDIDGKAIHVEILDTAGQDAYRPLRETFMHTGDGFLLVYSITDDQTLEELRTIREEILRVHMDRKVPMLVVGNKVDLASDRAVSPEEGKQLAIEFNCGFMEVTAKEDYKVKDAFHELIRKGLTKNPEAGGDSTAANIFGGGDTDITDGIDIDIVRQNKSGDKKNKEQNALEKSSSTRTSSSSKKEKGGGRCSIL